MSEWDTETPQETVQSRAQSAAQGTDALLERPLPEEYRQEWTTKIAAPAQETRVQTRSAFIFRIGQEWLAFPGSIMAGVVPLRPVRPLPHQRDGLFLGLVTLRGELLLCASLAKLLGIPAASNAVSAASASHGPAGRFLILGMRVGQQVVVPVDEVVGMVRYAPEALQELSGSLAAGARYTKSLLPWNGHLVSSLDGELVLYAIDRAIT